MAEPASDHADEAIDRPAIYRTLLLAFLVWAAHFTVSYGAVLVFPGQPAARIITVVAGIGALAVLAWWGFGLPHPRSSLAAGMIGLAAAAVVFGTFPALVG
ncbi:hypothetical protein [Qipengyuania sp.]|uniref:hypothetical protein n=1 Tax=Qipengyuania sp. TaxID=2004515 RepID=UPI0035C80322